MLTCEFDSVLCSTESPGVLRAQPCLPPLDCVFKSTQSKTQNDWYHFDWKPSTQTELWEYEPHPLLYNLCIFHLLYSQLSQFLPCETVCVCLKLFMFEPRPVLGGWVWGLVQRMFTHSPLYKVTTGRSSCVDRHIFIHALTPLCSSHDLCAHPAGSRALLPECLLWSRTSGRL